MRISIIGTVAPVAEPPQRISFRLACPPHHPYAPCLLMRIGPNGTVAPVAEPPQRISIEAHTRSFVLGGYDRKPALRDFR